jgi:hypothetical protein
LRDQAFAVGTPQAADLHGSQDCAFCEQIMRLTRSPLDHLSDSSHSPHQVQFNVIHGTSVTIFTEDTDKLHH